MATDHEQITALMKRAFELGKVEEAEAVIVTALRPFLAQFPTPKKARTPQEREAILRRRGVLKDSESLAEREERKGRRVEAAERHKAVKEEEAKKRLSVAKARAKAMKDAHKKKK